MWQKREAEWERERVAREKLMAEVGGQILICGYLQVTLFLYAGNG